MSVQRKITCSVGVSNINSELSVARQQWGPVRGAETIDDLDDDVIISKPHPPGATLERGDSETSFWDQDMSSLLAENLHLRERIGTAFQSMDGTSIYIDIYNFPYVTSYMYMYIPGEIPCCFYREWNVGTFCTPLGEEAGSGCGTRFKRPPVVYGGLRGEEGGACGQGVVYKRGRDGRSL